MLTAKNLCTVNTSQTKIYRTIILPVVLYGCETWSLTLREGCRLRVFENRVLRRVFGPKRDKLTGEWRKLHNEELTDTYSLPNIVRVVKSRRMRWAGHVAHMGERRGVHRALGGKPEGKRPLGRPRHRWEDNINTFAASYLNTQGLNNSCLKSPASTLVDLNFQLRALRSFSLNQLRNLSL